MDLGFSLSGEALLYVLYVDTDEPLSDSQALMHVNFRVYQGHPSHLSLACVM